MVFTGNIIQLIIDATTIGGSKPNGQIAGDRK
jgi:hypothetical protein